MDLRFLALPRSELSGTTETSSTVT
uniref:Uncharacterized protein n=1 Tax=Anguilla anguilla TaxID=7936 RepID=A0A0E9Q5Y6_ANGAN